MDGTERGRRGENMTKCNYVRHSESNQTVEQTEENFDGRIVGGCEPKEISDSMFRWMKKSFWTYWAYVLVTFFRITNVIAPHKKLFFLPILIITPDKINFFLESVDSFDTFYIVLCAKKICTRNSPKTQTVYGLLRKRIDRRRKWKEHGSPSWRRGHAKWGITKAGNTVRRSASISSTARYLIKSASISALDGIRQLDEKKRRKKTETRSRNVQEQARRRSGTRVSSEGSDG